MCLASESKTPSINNEYNIECYKILYLDNGNLYTPFENFHFPIGKTITDTAPDTSFEAFGVLILESGYFHAYKTIEAAQKKLNEIKRKDKRKRFFKIYKAEIPVGVPFYEGQFQDLCSKQLKIIEECFD